jgi:hypothetical protein
MVVLLTPRRRAASRWLRVPFLMKHSTDHDDEQNAKRKVTSKIDGTRRGDLNAL